MRIKEISEKLSSSQTRTLDECDRIWSWCFLPVGVSVKLLEYLSPVPWPEQSSAAATCIPRHLLQFEHHYNHWEWAESLIRIPLHVMDFGNSIFHWKESGSWAQRKNYHQTKTKIQFLRVSPGTTPKTNSVQSEDRNSIIQNRNNLI